MVCFALNAVGTAKANVVMSGYPLVSEKYLC